MKTLYKIQNLSFSYEPGKPVFRNVNLEIDFNEFTVLNGKTGSGKTTFCRILAGLLKSFEGSIHMENSEIRKKPVDKISQKIIYIKQEPLSNVVAANPDEDLSIWQYKFHLKFNNNFEKNRVQALRFWEIEDIKNQPVWELSSGQIKRIGLSALLLNPDKYWIIDEPVIGLDDNLLEKLISVLELRKKQGLGTFIASHQSNIFKQITNNFLKIENKNIITLKSS